MAGFHDVLANIALIVGGTQPDATNKPYFYSGAQKGDNSEISGIKGCYLGPPETVDCDPPFAVVLLGNGSDGGDFRGSDLLTQGNLFKQDFVRLQVCVGRTQPQYQHDTLIGFRDTVPATFAGKLGINATANVMTVFPQDYRHASVEYGGTEYMCIEFRLRVQRDVVGQTFSA